MSDTQKPPREIWVTKSGTDPIVKGLAYIHYSAQPNTTNFINKQLYDQLMQQALAMREALALYADPKNHEDHGLGSITEADAIIALEKFDEFMSGVK